MKVLLIYRGKNMSRNSDRESATVVAHSTRKSFPLSSEVNEYLGLVQIPSDKKGSCLFKGGRA